MRPGFDGRVLVRSAHGAQVAFPARMVLSGLTDSGVSPLCGAGLLRGASSHQLDTHLAQVLGAAALPSPDGQDLSAGLAVSAR